MFKKLFTVIFISTLTLAFVPACAEQDKDAVVIADTAQATAKQVSTPVAESAKPGDNTGVEQDSVMDQPLNFSTPEDVEKSIEKVRQEAGDAKALALKKAMDYILYYDLSLGNDRDKMYAKLNGSTPNAIIARMKR